MCVLRIHAQLHVPWVTLPESIHVSKNHAKRSLADYDLKYLGFGGGWQKFRILNLEPKLHGTLPPRASHDYLVVVKERALQLFF